jgi:hypothetical protein
MKKAMLILLSVAAYTFSLNDVSVPNRFNPSTPARSSEVNANFDTLASRINQNNDTIEQKFIRFSDLESGDSILEKCRIDTARIDHIRSNPEADSMTITKVDINGGTIDGTVIGANSAAAGTFTTVTASGAIVGSTINTGYGAYEIGQSNRTTDSPTFSGLTLNNNLTLSGSIIGSGADGIQIKTDAIDDADIKRILIGHGDITKGPYIGLYNNKRGSPFQGRLVLKAGDGSGGVTGAIEVSPRMYFGTRPERDDYYYLAFNDRLLLNTSGPSAQIMNNAYYASGWKYRVADGASLVVLGDGTVSIRTAADGTVDGALTWNYGLEMNNLGNVAIGKSTFVSGNKLEVEGNTLVNGTIKGDSIKSTKGISCTQVNATGTIKGDSIKSTKGISCTQVNATGTIKGDSIKSTKGISCTQVNATGTIKGDSIKSTKGISCNNINNTGFLQNTGYIASIYPSNSSTHYRDVYQYRTATASFTGTMKFTLPKTWSGTMLTFTIKGYNYVSGQGAWECVIGGYNDAAGWKNCSAEIRGSAPFSQVRLAHDGTKCCLLLGTTSTVWSYPQVAITEVFASYLEISGWGEPYSMSFITSETGITNIVTPTTSIYGNNAVVPGYARIDDTLWVGTTNATKLYDGWYLEGSYLCTLSGFTETVTCTTYYVKCGKAVTLTFSPAAGQSNANYINISTGLMPASIRPAREMFWKLCRWSFGLYVDTDPYVEYIQTLNNVFSIVPFESSGSKRITHSFSISYLTY